MTYPPQDYYTSKEYKMGTRRAILFVVLFAILVIVMS